MSVGVNCSLPWSWNIVRNGSLPMDRSGNVSPAADDNQTMHRLLIFSHAMCHSLTVSPGHSTEELILKLILVSCHLDYFNSLLNVIADTDLIKLQHIQNGQAHLLTKSPPFSHSVLQLRSLPWLSVRFRILFKITLLTYKTLQNPACLFLHHACRITPIPFTEIKHRN